MEKTIIGTGVKSWIENHFSYLLETQESNSALEAIATEAYQIQFLNHRIEIRFPENRYLYAYPPSDILEDGPSSYIKILKEHEILELRTSSFQLLLALGSYDEAGDNMEHLANAGYDQIDGIALENIISPLVEAENVFWIFHPVDKNEHGEPLLYKVEGSSLVDPQIADNVATIFLRKLSKLVDVPVSHLTSSTSGLQRKEIHQSEVKSRIISDPTPSDYFAQRLAKKKHDREKEEDPGVSKEILIWWNKIPKDLKDELVRKNAIRNDADVIRTFENGKYLLDYKNAKNLSPFQRLSSLKKLNLIDFAADSLSTLKNLTWIEELTCDINYSDRRPICKDLTPLIDLTRLKKLLLKNHDIEEVSPLSGLTNLTTLELEGNPLTSVRSLSSLNNLQRLLISLKEGMYFDCKFAEDMKYLDTLGISGYKRKKIKFQEPESLAKLKSLTELRLKDIEVSDNISIIRVIAELPQLKRLQLSNIEITTMEPLYKNKTISLLELDEDIKTKFKHQIRKNMPWCEIL